MLLADFFGICRKRITGVFSCDYNKIDSHYKGYQTSFRRCLHIISLSLNFSNRRFPFPLFTCTSVGNYNAFFPQRLPLFWEKFLGRVKVIKVFHVIFYYVYLFKIPTTQILSNDNNFSIRRKCILFHTLFISMCVKFTLLSNGRMLLPTVSSLQQCVFQKKQHLSLLGKRKKRQTIPRGKQYISTRIFPDLNISVRKVVTHHMNSKKSILFLSSSVRSYPKT